MPQIILWTVAVFATFFINTGATAEDTSPETYCWQQQARFIDKGLEMPVGPIETDGQRWQIIWGDSAKDIVPGDKIFVPFAGGMVRFSGHTPEMADILLTLNDHWAAGREPFAVRYEDTVYMIVSYEDQETGEPWCEAMPFTK